MDVVRSRLGQNGVEE